MRYRDPEAVVDEIECLHRRYGVREIQIEDDNFTIKRQHVVEICEHLIARDLPVIWSLPNGVRIDRLDPELLRLMKRAGCYLMALGIESATQRILDMVKKKLDVGLVRYPTANGVLGSLVQRVVTWSLGLLGYLVYLRMKPALKPLPVPESPVAAGTP